MLLMQKVENYIKHQKNNNNNPKTKPFESHTKWLSSHPPPLTLSGYNSVSLALAADTTLPWCIKSELKLYISFMITYAQHILENP